jgi:hypothetical protein
MSRAASKERTLGVFRGRLSRLRVANHPALFFNPWIEGYRDYAFGGLSGPVVETSSLFHELGHAAQFGVKLFRTRASDRGFRFKMPMRFIYDRMCVEPTSNQATLRELDTFAHQLHLMRKAGFKVSDKHFMAYSARLMRHMADWWHVPGGDEDARAAYCQTWLEKRYAQLTVSEVEDKLEAWLDATHRRLQRQKQRYPQPWTDQTTLKRYRVDGTVWACDTR